MSIQKPHNVVCGHIFPRGALAGSLCHLRKGLGETTRFYQHCPQQANQVAFGQCLEFSKRLMLLSWLKWVRFIFTPSCISQSLPVLSLQTTCATAGESHLYKEGQRVNLWPPNRNRRGIELSAEEKLGRLESYRVITPYQRQDSTIGSLFKNNKQTNRISQHKKLQDIKMQYTSLGLSQVCECWEACSKCSVPGCSLGTLPGGTEHKQGWDSKTTKPEANRNGETEALLGSQMRRR